ncbi:hypothetical protein [Rhizobium aegyptiacum]|uniref:hypothetical protein n=1 Tax=Rhizobium aegyptiacum TaxID=1764550 RepID=UPI0007E59918|nr:hypothetical protein [Rhizobium aegyptiacum]
MTNVITFPNAASAADVICTPLNITFPRIYRAALRDQVHYTLSPDRSPYPDLVEMKQVRSIVSGDRYSVIVRRHQSFDMAHAYLIGLKDGNQSERYDTICQTDQGYFTLLERATKPSWPSPMIFYVADFPENTPLFESGCWERSISADGRWYEAGMLDADLKE